MKVYQFDSRNIGPIPMILGGVLAVSVAVGLLILASMFAVFFMVAGLVLATASGIALGVRRLLRGKESGNGSGEHIATITEVSQLDEVADDDGIKMVEVEIVETSESRRD
tara:strand:- start:1596 stop:1925 length:330 start_codon:yes stop_codon:yes gene_type:complete